MLRWIRMMTILLEVNTWPCKLSRITYHNACWDSRIHHIWHWTIWIVMGMIYRTRRRAERWWAISNGSRLVWHSIRRTESGGPSRPICSRLSLGWSGRTGARPRLDFSGRRRNGDRS